MGRDLHQRHHAGSRAFPLRAFTLVELLVVMVVIIILAAMLLPALHRAKKAAHNTTCKSNLRQMGFALASYTSDFQAYPFYFEWYNGAPHNNYWPELLKPYCGAAWNWQLCAGRANASSRLYLCPGYAALPTLWQVDYFGRSDWFSFHGLGAYAYNWQGVTLRSVWSLGLGGSSPQTLADGTRVPVLPTRECEVARPDAMVAITDAPFGVASDSTQYGVSDFSHDFGFGGYEIESGQLVSDGLLYGGWTKEEQRQVASAIRNRHLGKWNALFCDGHVQAHATSELFNFQDDAVLSLRNKDNLPHREMLPNPP